MNVGATVLFGIAISICACADDSKDASNEASTCSGPGGICDGGVNEAGPATCIHTYQPFTPQGDTLPSGDCVFDPNEPVCKQVVCSPGNPCCCETPKYYSCECSANTWSCVLTGTGKSSCVCDAGTDGG